MFGYFRPYDANLTTTQLQTFHAYYCRLCCGLRSMGGQRARYLTTFDAAIYYMIYNMAVGLPTPPSFRCQKLSKKWMRITEKDEVAMRFVRMVLVAVGEKVRDDALDGDGWKAGIVRLLCGKAIKAAQSFDRDFTQKSYEATERINAMQNAGNCDVTELLETYGEVVADTIGYMCKVEAPYLELYKSIAAWTFYVDILCDYDEDFAKNSFNPLRKDGKPTLCALFDADYEKLFLLNKRICGRVLAALNAVKNDSFEWLTLHNILVHALTTVVPDCLEGKDVKFHYFKELFKNRKNAKKRRKRFDAADTAMERGALQ